MNEQVAERIITKHREFDDVERIESLNKGFSEDRKFVLWEEGKPSYLFRLCPPDRAERRQKEFDFLSHHHDRGILCPKPLAFGTDETLGLCYLAQSYIWGESAEEAITELPEHVQFEIGLAAGRELRKIHEMACPDPDYDWASHREAKFRRHIADVRKHGFHYHGEKEVEAYAEGNLDLLKTAGIRFQHDDYHLSSVIVRGGRFVGVIDFNRWDWGDPIEDFDALPRFSTPVSVPFSRGQILGYMDGKPDEEFWKRYNLYAAMHLGIGLVWTYYHNRDNMDGWHQGIRYIVETHDFKDGGPPTWFIG